jgi:subtilisin family serine protease
MKRSFTMLMVLALLFTTLAPVVQARADEPSAAAGVQSASLQTAASGVYVVVMRLDPVINFSGAVGAASVDSALAQLNATKPAPGAKLDARSADVQRYADYLKSTHAAALQTVGADTTKKLHSYVYALNGFAAQLTPAQAYKLAKQSDVVMVLKDQIRYVQTDSSPAFLGLSSAGSAWIKGYTGEGVIVGVIDTGIWPEHPSFADDGSYPELAVTLEDTPENPACNFGNVVHNLYDAPFTCNNKLIGARQMLNTYRTLIGADPDEYDSARDDDGHGTHTASTSAGNANVKAFLYGRPRGTISGIAPRARIIAYKGLGNQGGFTSDLAAAIDQAVADGVDVINYSVGGGASLTGGDDIAYLFAADAGVFVATSAGNAGSAPGTIGGPASVPWITTVGASTQSRFFQGTVTSSGGWSFTGASLTAGTRELALVDAAAAGDDLCTPGSLDPAVVTGKIVLCRRGVVGRVDKSFAVFSAGGVGMILYNNSNNDNLFSDTHWVPSVHIDNTPGVAIKNYIANNSNPTARIVGGQISRWDTAPSMTIFSSRGPNPVAADIIKPDITAPGLQILAGNSPTPNLRAYPSELFQAIAGTSMSSPHIAGIFALLKQAHPEWSPAVAKSAIMTTAYQKVLDNNRTTQADPFDMGAGHVNARRTDRGSLFQPGLAYDADFFSYLGFLCDAAPEIFTNPTATCSQLEAAGIPTKAINLNLASIGASSVPGKVKIIRTVTNVQSSGGAEQYRVDVKAPPGYQVMVSPRQFRLRPGQSATYEIVVTNKNAPVDEWRFGSLTWSATGGGIEVYSPIAVRGSLIAVPDGITGSGSEGSASFEVQFGYTGAYTATAHGLEPAVVINDNVRQDPDQNFDPADVTAGGANVHEFNLSGAAFFRVAIPPSATEADADLDVFVYDPDGNQVATSTNGGTDEVVDIVLPADGVWQVYVHGWQAPGGDSDYSMSSWVVSATPGGSLTIDAAPTTAVIGEVGTVDVSWSGLDSGTAYLGAVSHSNASGLIDLTLVEVDTGAVAAADSASNAAPSAEAMDEKVFLPLVSSEDQE